jgi:hypothetical protein
METSDTTFFLARACETVIRAANVLWCANPALCYAERMWMFSF